MQPKFEIGDKVISKRTGREGEVIDIEMRRALMLLVGYMGRKRWVPASECSLPDKQPLPVVHPTPWNRYTPKYLVDIRRAIWKKNRERKKNEISRLAKAIPMVAGRNTTETSSSYRQKA